MWLKMFFSFVFFVFVVSLLIFYWFMPFSVTEFNLKNGGFNLKPQNYNFSEGDFNLEEMQFFPNMRFSDSEISYMINECPLKKSQDMRGAFEILEEKTSLVFYSVPSNPDILITCDSKDKIEDGLFIAGEGGPTNITKTDNFNVILDGRILLIKDSNCERPNIAIHELMHVLGFNHSDNPSNIMYPVTQCSQVIGDDQINLINELYSVPSYADLVFEDVSARMHGKYLDVNFSVRNGGLADSVKSKIIIYADETEVKEVDLDSLQIGHGLKIMLTNIWVKSLKFEELRFVISTDIPELDKSNNEISLVVKE